MQHGLPGSVQIEVEHVSPAALAPAPRTKGSGELVKSCVSR
jgi:hypothetical protein